MARVARTKKEIRLTDYVPDPNVGDECKRAVAFLLWAAQNLPYRFTPVAHLVRVAQNLDRTPREDTPRVKLFKSNRISRIRKILREEYRKGLESRPAFGYRATVDESDALRSTEERSVQQHRNSGRRLRQVHDMIDPSKLRGEDRKLYDTHGEGLKKSEAIANKFFLPANTESDKKKKK